jgi:hypothetical protein
MSLQAVWANNVSTTLAYGISSTQTSVAVTSVVGFPTIEVGTQGCSVTFISATNSSVFEIALITGITGNTLTVVRGYDGNQPGTTPLAFNAGDTVSLLITAGSLASLAHINGDISQVFEVANALEPPQAVALGQFTFTFPSPNFGIITRPDGYIRQWTNASIPAISSAYTSTINLPETYPHYQNAAMVCFDGILPQFGITLAIQPTNNSQVSVTTSGNPSLGSSTEYLGVVIYSEGW